jgi:hypothetical protein
VSEPGKKSECIKLKVTKEIVIKKHLFDGKNQTLKNNLVLEMKIYRIAFLENIESL